MGIFRDIVMGPAREKGDLSGRPEKMPTPPKEGKKDSSVLGGKSYMKTWQAIDKFKKDPAFRYKSYYGKNYTKDQMKELAGEALAKAGGYYEKNERNRVIELLKKDTEAKLKDPKIDWKEKNDLKEKLKFFKEKL